MSDGHSIIATMGGILLAAALSFAFATAGEPQAVWLWRDILGLLA